ncbi:MAG: hypothetical protein ACI94Y_002397 [Maribacter sp.]|jgi:hypothetical protein
MELNPRVKIYKMIRKLKVVANKQRQEFLCHLIEGIIKSRSVIFTEIADKIDKPIKISSIDIYPRFFQSSWIRLYTFNAIFFEFCTSLKT